MHRNVFKAVIRCGYVEKDWKMDTKLSHPVSFKRQHLTGMSANGQTLVSNEGLSRKPESNFSWQGSISDNSLWAYPSCEVSGCHFAHRAGKKKKVIGGLGKKIKCFSAGMIQHLWICEEHLRLPLPSPTCVRLPFIRGTCTGAHRWGGHGNSRTWKTLSKGRNSPKMRKEERLKLQLRDGLSLQACSCLLLCIRSEQASLTHFLPTRTYKGRGSWLVLDQLKTP